MFSLMPQRIAPLVLGCRNTPHRGLEYDLPFQEGVNLIFKRLASECTRQLLS